jgi:hypothetical protein
MGQKLNIHRFLSEYLNAFKKSSLSQAVSCVG